MNKIFHGDSIDVLKQLESNSVDLLASDPPYGYGFMGKAWDKALPDIEIFHECFRTLKPGAFAFVMSAPRSDVCARMMLMLEEVGFNIAFTPMYWTYATGFPKAMNIGKMVDKRNGTGQQGEFKRKVPDIRGNNYGQDKRAYGGDTVDSFEHVAEHPDAVRLDGSYGGFQPKPAVEVIIVAMKPLSEKTYVDQALKNGKGVTWLDDCRVPAPDNAGVTWTRGGSGVVAHSGSKAAQSVPQMNNETTLVEPDSRGRFPANLLVENSILDTISCTCTHEGNTPIVQEDYNSDEGGTKATTQNESREVMKQSGASRKLIEESENHPNTEPLFPQPGLRSTTSEEGRNGAATTGMGAIEYGCEPSESETGASAFGAEQPKTSTSTTSSPTRASQTFALKSQMAASCALHATGKRTPGESSQQYSRFFSLDAWAQNLPFLQVAKAAKSEKNAGLDTHPNRASELNSGGIGRKVSVEKRLEANGENAPTTKNHHPTVKPLTLMAYLITLGSRPGDTVLDPFLGSGTTAIAAKELGRQFIGIEREAEYVAIAEARLQAVPPTLL